MNKNLATFSKHFEMLRTKFAKKQVKKLIEIASMINWRQGPQQICKQLNAISENELENYIWMVGTNPSYFIQYQVDSYAIMKIYEKCVIVWKPKYIEYPSIYQLSTFPEELKNTMKNFSINIEENFGEVSDPLCQKITNYIELFYAMHFFSFKEQEFQTNLVTELKHYVSRSSRLSYWHCAFDDHLDIDATSRKTLYLRLRIKGAKDKYDKDFIIFSHQGKRDSFFRGKKIQVVSFLAMLMIFVTIISCSGDDKEGICYHRDTLLVIGAAIMMGLMGLRVATRAKNKKAVEKKLKEN